MDSAQLAFTPVPAASFAARPTPSLAARRLTDAQIRIVRMSVARTCTDGEFDHFIAVAERTGLDPLRRQLCAIVLNAADPEKRAMIPWATIDGLRAIAARSGDYRPSETAPTIEIDPDRIDPLTNPLGIMRATVTVWRRFDGAWFAISGEAWWDEHAALVAEASGEVGARVRKLADNWRRMGRALIVKCAEAQALRRGWPEDLSGLYGEEELHRAELDQLLAHERAVRAGEEQRQRLLAGSRSLLFSFGPGGALETIDRNAVAEKVAAFIATAASAEEIEAFQAANREALQTFWDWAPGDALDIKRQAERAIARMRRKSNKRNRARDGKQSSV